MAQGPQAVVGGRPGEGHAGPQLLVSYLESAPDATVIVDEDGRIVLVNAQLEALFGYDRAELIGERVELLLPERFRQAHVAHRRDYAAEPHTRPMGAGLELAGRHRDGSEVAVDISLSPLASDDGTLMAAAIRDVTERRRLERARDNFIRDAAHELRTPLATIATLGETLSLHLHRLTEAQLEEALRALRRQSQRASTLVSNLLDLSQLDGGRAAIHLEPVALRPVVERSLESAPPPEGTEVALELGGATVIADSSRLEQVVTNLLTNAYRYGGAHVTVRVREDGDEIVLEIADDGPGVPPELAGRLFEPFTRGRDAGDVGGSGIGLALSARLMESFGGSLEHTALEPQGTLMACRLRRAS